MNVAHTGDDSGYPKLVFWVLKLQKNILKNEKKNPRSSCAQPIYRIDSETQVSSTRNHH